METNGGFWSLVRHDMKVRKHRRLRLNRQWRITYLAVAAVIALIVTTYTSLQGHLDFRYVWFVTFGLPVMVLGLSAGLTLREWKNGTVGWWLALPVSRLRLVSSKFVASVWRGMIIFLAVYCIIALLTIYATLLQGTFSLPATGAFLLAGLKWFALLICVCPFFGAFGVLLAILRESRARPILPLVWIAFGGAWWLMSSQDHAFLNHPETAVGTVLDWSAPLWIGLLISWILAYFMIHLTSYLLEKQMNL